MLEEFGRISDGHRRHTNVARQQNDWLNNDIRPVHSDRYRAVPTARRLPVTETGLMIPERVIEQVTAERRTLIVFAPESDGALRFSIDHLKLNAVTLRGTSASHGSGHGKLGRGNSVLNTARKFSVFESGN